jgi:ribosome-binding factor A
MEELLARTRELDAEVARRAVGARPAGDPDPYRYPRDEEGEQSQDLSVLRSAPASSPRPPEPAE